MIKWCVEHKLMVVLLCVMIILGGGYAYSSLERQENPAITPPLAVVTCVYPGASPEDVERQIVKPLEKKISTMDKVKTLESFSLNSVGIIKVTVEDMSDQEILQNWEKLKDKVDQAEVDLPDGAEKPEVDTEVSNSYGLVIGLSADDYTHEDIKRAAKTLEKSLSSVDGVAEVKITGDVDQEISIELDMTKLQQYGISPTTIATALKARNIDIPGGNLEFGAVKVPVQISGAFKTVNEIENTIVGVSRNTGLPLALKDLAQIRQVDAAPDYYSTVGTQKAVLVCVRFSEGQNVLNAGMRVEKVLEEYRKNELYQFMDMTILTNQPEFVKEAIDLFVNNLMTAVFLVIAVVWLFMGWRSALVVSVPIVLVTTIVILYMKFTGIPLHQISIASLIISLSLLVANGIVANDNMYLYLQQGKPRRQAIIEGVKDVNIPILTSTLTTIASFLPLIMMQGSAGKFASALPILVSVSLIASYFTALTVVPALGDRVLQVKGRTEGVLGKLIGTLKLDVAGKWMNHLYHQTLKNAIKSPKRTLALFFSALLLVSCLVPFLGMKVFPPVERDQYVLSLKFPNGYLLDETRKKVMECGEILKGEKSVTSFGAQVGDGFVQYYDTFMAARRGTHIAEILVNGERDNAEAVANRVQSELSDVMVTVKYLELNMPQDQPVQIRISGQDIDVLKSTAESIETQVKNMEGVWGTNINYGQDTYKLKVNVDEVRANLAGISNYDVASTVRMAVNGSEIGNLKPEDVDDDEIPIVIRLEQNQLKKVNDLESVFLTSQITGKNIPLRQVAALDTDVSVNEIVRRNEARTITVGLYLNETVSSDNVLEQVKDLLKDYRVPEGYTMSYGGDNEFAEETFSSMVVPAIVAVLLIYLIIAVQFGNLRDPILIMGTIPLSFIGIIGGLWIMGYPIGFMAMLGAISLMGVVVNNGIVLIDYIKLLESQGIAREAAVEEASRTRMRPIIIGMITTVISLVPMMISGGPLWQPLATALNFGMVFSTLLTLIGIPAAYTLIHPAPSVSE